MTEKKRILFIVEAMGGGIFTYIVDLANELADTYDMYIAYAVRPQTPTDFESYFKKEIHLIEVKNFRRSVNPIYDLKALFEIKGIAKRVKPDIIHLHSSKAGALGRIAFDGKKTPVFYTPHGYSFLMRNYGFLKRSLYRLVETICAKRRCTTISCSEGEHMETLKLTRRAVCINNGIDISLLQKTTDSMAPSEKHPFRVFTIGRICYQKNPELFNQIAAELPDISFLWVGDGELRKILTSPNIEVTGWLERKEVIKHIMSGDVFLLTSLWEGLPISLLESMYLAKTCIVSNVIGNNDVIKDEFNGKICSNAEEFTKAIRCAAAGVYKSQGKQAHEDLCTLYNSKRMTRRYIEIYEAKR